MTSHGAAVIDMCAWVHPWDRKAIEQFREGGIHCVGVTCTTWEGSHDTLQKIADLHDLVNKNRDIAVLARSAADIRQAREDGRLAILLHFQNTSPLDDDIRFVRLYAELGVRVIQLTYNTQNSIGSGCYEANDSGLSEFGRCVVRELNECKVLVDLSHCGDRTTLDAVETSTAPVAITHANLKSMAPKTRNKTAEICRTVAESGGVIGLAAYSNLLPNGEDTTIDEFCDMVDALVELVGTEHVGIGTDYYCGMPPEMVIGWTTGRWSREVPAHMDLAGSGWQGEIAPFTEWFASPRDMPNISAALKRRGYDEQAVDAIMGENWVKLLTSVQA